MAVAEALLLHVYDRVEEASTERVVQWILAGFDINNAREDTKYKFPPDWEYSRWEAAGGDGFCHACNIHCKAITEESNGSLETATKMVIGSLKHLEGDERTMFLSSVMTDGLCPFNFHVSMEELTIKAVNEIAETSPKLHELFNVLSGKSGKRFPSAIDKADYVASLEDGMARRERVAFMMMMEFWAKQAGANELRAQLRKETNEAKKLLNLMREPTIPPELMELMMGMPAELWDKGVRVKVVSLGNALDDFMKPSPGGCKDPECSCDGTSC